MSSRSLNYVFFSRLALPPGSQGFLETESHRLDEGSSRPRVSDRGEVGWFKMTGWNQQRQHGREWRKRGGRESLCVSGCQWS